MKIMPIISKTYGEARRLTLQQKVSFNDAVIFESYLQNNMDYFLTTDSDYDKLSNLKPYIRVIRFPLR